MDAYRGDVGELRHEMQLGFARIDARLDRLAGSIDARFDSLAGSIDARFDSLAGSIDARFGNTESRFAKLETNIDARFGNSELRFEKFEAKMEAIMEKGLRKQTQFFFLAWSVLLAAIVGLYARVS